MSATVQTIDRLRDAKSRDATGTSSSFASPLVKNAKYRIVGEENFWYKFAASTGSVAAGDDDAVYVPAGQAVFDTPVDDAKLYLHVIRVSVSGKVNVARAEGA